MESYKTEKIRNVSLLAHGSAGKTSLVEAMLFATGAINRLGRVEDGTTIADFDEEERERKISLATALVPCEWKGGKINALDTPGYADFIGEVRQKAAHLDVAKSDTTCSRFNLCDAKQGGERFEQVFDIRHCSIDSFFAFRSVARAGRPKFLTQVAERSS